MVKGYGSCTQRSRAAVRARYRPRARATPPVGPDANRQRMACAAAGSGSSRHLRLAARTALCASMSAAATGSASNAPQEQARLGLDPGARSVAHLAHAAGEPDRLSCGISLGGAAELPALETIGHPDTQFQVERLRLLELTAELSHELLPVRWPHQRLQIQHRAPRLGPTELAVEPVAEPGGPAQEVEFPEAIAAGIECEPSGRGWFSGSGSRFGH